MCASLFEISFIGRVCLSDVAEMRNTILEEAEKSKLCIHSGATNMYQYLKYNFCWPGMKKQVVEHVATCLTS